MHSAIPRGGHFYCVVVKDPLLTWFETALADLVARLVPRLDSNTAIFHWTHPVGRLHVSVLAPDASPHYSCCLVQVRAKFRTACVCCGTNWIFDS